MRVNLFREGLLLPLGLNKAGPLDSTRSDLTKRTYQSLLSPSGDRMAPVATGTPGALTQLEVTSRRERGRPVRRVRLVTRKSLLGPSPSPPLLTNVN